MAYDPQLDRIDTTIRAMYRMYHGRLHDQLALSKEEGVLAFQDQPFPRTEKQLFELIQRCPAVVPAALQLLAQYQWIEGDTRREYYENEAMVRKSA